MKATKEELQIINSRLPGTVLNESQVEVLPFRLFDTNVTDRFTIMSQEMMNKLLLDANDGKIAFNALHKSSSTLPVGRSIIGQINTENNVSELRIKLYAVTQRPDGTAMEDGKDLADRYNTGAVYACSAGVYVGHYKCSVCGNDIRDWQNCDHFPGTTYIIDEKPVICTALMTGRDIQNGIAMDCGCYECSAVTAGGVRNASVLTETFSSYDKGADAKDFKKAQFEGKTITDYITLTPYMAQTTKEENNMDPKQDALIQKNYELIEAKAKTDVELASLKGEFNLVQSTLATANSKLSSLEAEFEATKTTLTSALAEKEEFVKKVADLEAAALTAKEEFETVKGDFESLKTASNEFKAAYISVVEANGVKIKREADYASKTVTELVALNDEYLAEIALLPSGRQSLEDNGDSKPVESSYAGIPDEMFKSA